MKLASNVQQLVARGYNKACEVYDQFGRQIGVTTATVIGTGSVFAQSTDPFTDAMTTATTKVGTYAAALVGLAAVSTVFMIGMKYVKKIPRAA